MSDQSNEAGRAEARRLASLSDEQLIAEVASASGLPQSALGGLHPELLARITAAKVALGSFEAELIELRAHGGLVDYFSWAQWMHAELRGLLDTIERLGK